MQDFLQLRLVKATDLHECEEMSRWKPGVLLQDQLVDVWLLVVSFRAGTSARCTSLFISFVPGKDNRKTLQIPVGQI